MSLLVFGVCLLLEGEALLIETESARFVNTDDGLIDMDTGELIDIAEDGHPIKKTGREPGWFRGIKNGFRGLARMKLGAPDYQVFLSICGRIKYGNRLVINQSAMAEDLGISRASVNRSLKLLESKGVISKVERSSKNTEYVIHRSICWCGTNNLR